MMVSIHAVCLVFPTVFQIPSNVPPSVLIGQRGNDNIITGPGNDVAIGDAGTNTLTTNLDIPRIYQVYRSLTSPAGSGYDANARGFGFVFISDFDLLPHPFRYVDSQASLIDKLITFDDASSQSNMLQDILGIPGSIATTSGYCVKPMFKIVPGFISKTNELHGNDGKRLDLCNIVAIS